MTKPTRQRLDPKLWRLVADRDNRRCMYCAKFDPRFIIEHVIPEARGGHTAAYNLVVACRSCNARKSRSVWVPMNLDIITANNAEWRTAIIERAVNKPEHLLMCLTERIAWQWNAIGTEWKRDTYDTLKYIAGETNRPLRDILDEMAQRYIQAYDESIGYVKPTPYHTPPAARAAREA